MQSSARNDTLRGPSAEIGSCHFCLRVSEVPRNSLLRPYCHLGSSVWCGIASLPNQEEKAVVFALKSSSGSRLSRTLANRLALLFQCLNFGVLDIFIKMCPAAILSVPVISRRCFLWRRTMRSGRLAAGGESWTTHPAVAAERCLDSGLASGTRCLIEAQHSRIPAFLGGR